MKTWCWLILLVSLLAGACAPGYYEPRPQYPYPPPGYYQSRPYYLNQETPYEEYMRLWQQEAGR